VIQTIKRAGTIETFPRVQAIGEFEELCRLRARYNTIVDGKPRREFSICHKMPLNHPSMVGVTAGINLFIGLTSLNQTAGREYGDHIEDSRLYVHRSQLNPNYLVGKDHTQVEIMGLLYRRFGDALLNHIVEVNHPVRNPRATLPDDLNTYGDILPNVLGMSLMDYFGEEGYRSFSQVFEWAYHYSQYTDGGRNKGGSKRFLPAPWEAVQQYLQTGDEFCCDGFSFEYALPISEWDSGW